MPTTTDPAYGAMKFKAGEIIVKFREGISQAGVQSMLLTDDVGILDEIGSLGLMLLSVPQGRELEKAEELNRNPLVEYAEPNYVVRIADPIAAEPHCTLRAPEVIPDDPYLPNQWPLSKIEAFAAWDITSGSEKVVIAFVDSGVDLAHPEFKDKIWTNDDPPGDADGDGDPDDDQNGYVDDVHGWDWVNWDNEPQDDYGHGTFVASIAAAKTNNGILIAGVSWGAEIMPIKVLDDQGHGWIYHITAGIVYAADKKANVINLSWWLSGPDSGPVQDAIDYAHDKGALVVAAAGNSGDDSYIDPAALDHVVSVAATDPDDEQAEFSTHNGRVDVAAPGTWMYGVLPWGVGQWQGTDTAAPHVSGLAALIWSVNPTLTNDEVESIIESTAVDLGEPGRDDYFGYGRIDANTAVMTTTHYLKVECDDPFSFLVCDDCDPPSRKITNPNTSCSTWSATAVAPWLSISSCEPFEGYTPSSVTVSIDKGGLLGYGVYTAPITVTSTMTNHVSNPRTITATVIYPSQCWKNYLPLLFKGS